MTHILSNKIIWFLYYIITPIIHIVILTVWLRYQSYSLFVKKKIHQIKSLNISSYYHDHIDDVFIHTHFIHTHSYMLSVSYCFEFIFYFIIITPIIPSYILYIETEHLFKYKYKNILLLL